MTEPIIRVEGLSKNYRGVPALKDVDFELRQGEIHALLGENGAGKSTLTKIIAGVVEPSSGAMFYKGSRSTFPRRMPPFRPALPWCFKKPVWSRR